jgi:N-acetylglucosaminyldiphosphoundecaprenol N-acetyl-beta-D-mannosaminyltransferase
VTTSANHASILGVRLDRFFSLECIKEVCQGFLDSDRTHCVFTPNPEILLYAREHPDYAALLNEADLALPDGFGIVLVHFLGRRGSIRKWAGIDVAELMIRLAAERGSRVMLLGGRGGVGDRAAERWRARIPRLDIVATADEVSFAEDGTAVVPENDMALADRIRESQPAVILVSTGHPKQERWIARHREAFPSARIMMGIGGAVDVWGGRYSRAPLWLRSLGLEWVWRLLQQPTRLPRILRATVVFPIRALTERRSETSRAESP